MCRSLVDGHPWQGIPLADMIRRFEPLPSAKYVAFTTLLRPVEMPGQRRDTLQWPYVEGLRMDEAMHPLTLMVTGLYERRSPTRTGRPPAHRPLEIRLQGIKSIVKIDSSSGSHRRRGASPIRTNTASTRT